MTKQFKLFYFDPISNNDGICPDSVVISADSVQEAEAKLEQRVPRVIITGHQEVVFKMVAPQWYHTA